MSYEHISFLLVTKKTLESPLDCKNIKPVNPEGNQLWIFIGRTDAEAETPIFWHSNTPIHLMRRADSVEKTLMQENIEDRRRRGWQRMRWLDGIINSIQFNKLLEIVKDREICCAAIHGVTKSRTRLSNWSDLIWSERLNNYKWRSYRQSKYNYALLSTFIEGETVKFILLAVVDLSGTFSWILHWFSKQERTVILVFDYFSSQFLSVLISSHFL